MAPLEQKAATLKAPRAAVRGATGRPVVDDGFRG